MVPAAAAFVSLRHELLAALNGGAGSSGSASQEENIATRGRVNKACYLATPPLGTAAAVVVM